MRGDFGRINWKTLRSLIREGICTKPTSDDYIRLMADDLRDTFHYLPGVQFVPLSRKLLAEPDVLEVDVWRLFELDTYAFTFSFYDAVKRTPEYESWADALKRLADEGHIDRQRLLTAVLDALSMGFKRNTLTGFIKFHDFLEPTIDELSERQDTFIELASNPAPHVVTFALGALKQLDKAGRLDDVAFLNAAPSVFTVRSKAQPKAALVLVRLCVERNAALLPQAIGVAGEALGHESPDVQQNALTLLESWRETAGEAVSRIVADRLDDLAASCRAQAEALVIEPSAAADTNNKTSFANDERELSARTEALPAGWRKAAGVADALAALSGTTAPSPLQFKTMDVPVLTGLRPVTAIETVDELIDATAHALEEVDGPDEVERIIDGISRLCDQRPADFEARTGPLLKRIDRADVYREGSSELLQFSTPEGLQQLLLTWLRGAAQPAQTSEDKSPSGPQTIWTARLNELAQRVATRTAAPLLAAPTHTGGWIDPRRFVERIQEFEAAGLPLPEMDVIQGLLRLAPGHRTAALRRAKAIKGTIGHAVRWALGNADGPTRKDRDQAALWLAAGRTRSPFGRLDALAAAGIKADGPNGIEPAAFDWNTATSQHTYDGKTYTHVHLRLNVSPPPASKTPDPLLPAVAVAHCEWGEELATAWTARWLGLIWPANVEWALALAAHRLYEGIDYSATRLRPDYAHLALLEHVDRPWSEIAVLTEWIALLSRDADARGVAIDVLIEAIGDGRAHPQAMGEMLARMTAAGLIKLNRAGGVLAEMARLSSMHTHFCRELLERWLTDVGDLPKDAHHLLELLLELSIELRLRLSAPARQQLERIKGGGKSARLAKKLLVLEAAEQSAMVPEALRGYLEGRFIRAERWAASKSQNAY